MQSSKYKMQNGRRAILGIVCSLMIAACGAPPVAKKATPSPTPAPLLAPEAVAIDKPVNVSFSTYSKEWPVGWLWIDPDFKSSPSRKNLKKGVLSVTIPAGKDLYGDNRTAPRYIKAIKGDFQIETRVKFSPIANYQGAGLLIFKDDNNYLRFERAYGGVGGGGSGLRIDVRTGDEHMALATPNDIQTDLPEVEMKLVRSGRTLIAYWREDENSEWREAGEYESDYPDTVFAGLIACNTAIETTVEFGYIRLLPLTAVK
jgi:beta-xylosidase